MIVSFNWLKEYVELDMTVEALEERLMMSGLNHEETQRVGDDLAIDLEVTSNRPDCLGHIGVAREVAVLWDRALKLPAAAPAEIETSAGDLTSVAIDCPDLCYRYMARVIRGVKVGPSPAWLVRRLETLGIAVINNIVDITNYVLMECGQPLHAFDFNLLGGKRIIVREATKGEKFEAIDHKQYELEAGVCVIADAEQAVALGGVMGGAETEVSESTADLLIESAEFAPLSIRNTARRLSLHSSSSYRFERGVDPEGVDWASRRCCELILDLGGGELASGSVDVGRDSAPRAPVTLRLSQLARILGIDIDGARVRRILTALGCREVSSDATSVTTIPPTWRRDLTREIDLVEEAGRIHGYDQIPEDVGVAMVASTQRREDRVQTKVRHVITAAGFDEAMTISAVQEAWCRAFSPWVDAAPLACETPVLRGADHLRLSLVPSLLAALRTNETLSNQDVELFEIAKVYLPQDGALPNEEKMLALAGSGDFLALKGVIEMVTAALDPAARIEVAPARHELFLPERSAELRLAGQVLGYLGEVSPAGLKQFELRRPTTVAEIKLSLLVEAARLVPRQAELSPYPPVTRDLNVEFDEAVRWADVAAIVRQRAGEHLESLEYQETYRDEGLEQAGKKSLLFRITLRSQTGTLTREEADQARDRVVDQLSQSLGGKLRA